VVSSRSLPGDGSADPRTSGADEALLALMDATLQRLIVCGLELHRSLALADTAGARAGIAQSIDSLDQTINQIRRDVWTATGSGRPAAGEGVADDVVWSGEITWRGNARLRENLFDRLEDHGARGDLRVDVRAVTALDKTGVALLIGANHRAHSLDRSLVLIDAHGPVTAALVGLGIDNDFHLVQLLPCQESGTHVSEPAPVVGSFARSSSLNLSTEGSSPRSNASSISAIKSWTAGSP
jgi:anti-anti-sigma regulatory factor